MHQHTYLNLIDDQTFLDLKRVKEPPKDVVSISERKVRNCLRQMYGEDCTTTQDQKPPKGNGRVVDKSPFHTYMGRIAEPGPQSYPPRGGQGTTQSHER